MRGGGQKADRQALCRIQLIVLAVESSDSCLVPLGLLLVLLLRLVGLAFELRLTGGRARPNGLGGDAVRLEDAVVRQERPLCLGRPKRLVVHSGDRGVQRSSSGNIGGVQRKLQAALNAPRMPGVVILGGGLQVCDPLVVAVPRLGRQLRARLQILPAEVFQDSAVKVVCRRVRVQDQRRVFKGLLGDESAREEIEPATTLGGVVLWLVARQQIRRALVCERQTRQAGAPLLV